MFGPMAATGPGAVWDPTHRHRHPSRTAGRPCSRSPPASAPSTLFHDEDVEYARRLNEAGVHCELFVLPGVTPDFDHAFSASEVAQNFWPRQADALRIAGKTAAKFNVPFIYEPLNRYETNLINRLGDGAKFIESSSLENIVLLADLFHMNIEESDLAASIRSAAKHIGHVHYADSNRRAMGFGHTDPAPIVAALKETGYKGHLSAEIFPLPDAKAAASQTIKSIRSVL